MNIKIYIKMPVISYGLLCLKVSNKYHNQIHNILLNTNSINIFDNICPKNKLNSFQYMKNDIQFLIISKKISYSFMTILTGLYDNNNIYSVKTIINNLTISEIDMLKNNDFKELVHKYFANNMTDERINNIFNKFLTIRDLLNEYDSNYNTPEWEIPKGKLSKNELMLNGAIREFLEETTIKRNDIYVYDNIEPIVEIFKGTDNKYYMYVYYISLLKENYEPNLSLSNEASIIKFMNLNECITYLRPENKKRKKIIYCIYLYLIKSI